MSDTQSPKRASTVHRIVQHGILAIVRVDDAAVVQPLSDALVQGGVEVLEITMTVPGALGLVEKLAGVLPESVLLGAGSVLDPETACAVISAGARFVVSPVFRPDILRAAHALDAPALPGCLTPTEMLEARCAGAELIKVFPAAGLGPRYIKDVLAPLPDLRLVPTGGVTPDNVADWFGAGVAAVGIGSALLDPVLIRERRWSALTDRAAHCVSAVRAAREALAAR